ncbi:MAG: protein tyrosine phosphatase family protein [Steroidobacteraceae bacterium]
MVTLATFRRRRTFAALLLGCSIICVGAAEAAAAPQSIAGIVAPNVVAISPLLVTAGQPDRASLLRLKSEGYAAVISLSPADARDAVPDEAAIVKSQGLEFIHIPIPWQTPEASHLQATAAALQRLQGRKVLVHCQMNMRASAITFLYRVIHAREEPAVAFGDMKKVWTPTDQWAKFVDEQLRANGVTVKTE